MAKRKKAKSRKKTSQPRDWARLWRHGTIAARVGTVVAVVVATLWGVPRLTAYAQQNAAVDVVEIRFTTPPAWLRGDLLETLERTAWAQLGDDPLHQEDLVEAHRALFDTGWFERVDQVRRRHPGLIEIDAVFVRPFAVVRSEGYDVLVDPDGCVLPRSYPAGEARPKFVTITGAHFERPTRPGMQWPGADVGAALRLLRLFDQRVWSDQIAEVDVSRYLSAQTITLVTDRGCRLRWGAPPGEESALEALSDLKLRYLDEHYELSRHIDRGHTGTLDLTRREGVFATE